MKEHEVRERSFAMPLTNPCHCMLLDGHPPIAAGRELWGLPKELAGPTPRVESDTLAPPCKTWPRRHSSWQLSVPTHSPANPSLSAMVGP